MKIVDYLQETDNQHSDVVDAFAYSMASQMAKIRNDYFLIYIRKKPKYLPEFIYRWFLSKFVVLAEFKK